MSSTAPVVLYRELHYPPQSRSFLFSSYLPPSPRLRMPHAAWTGTLSRRFADACQTRVEVMVGDKFVPGEVRLGVTGESRVAQEPPAPFKKGRVIKIGWVMTSTGDYVPI